MSSTDEYAKAVEVAAERWANLPTSRARTSVFCSVTPVPVGKPNPWHSTGTTTNEQEPVPSIVIQPPAIGPIGARIQEFAPVKLGYLIDIDTGLLLGDCLDAVILACEDALEAGELKRPVEIVPLVARGLPRGEAAVAVAGYDELCAAGCLAVMGPYITDNALALLPAMARNQVPLISNNGAKAFNSEFGFTLGNGGVSEESVYVAGWLRAKGYTRVGSITEVSPGGEEYSKAFRSAATRNGLTMVADRFVDQTGSDLGDALRELRDGPPIDAIAYLGYGYPVAMFNPILRELDWDPPRIMSTAFMWYINEPRMLDELEGWYGVDQVGDELGANPNPNFWPMVERFERRFGRRVHHAMVGCAYDQTRATVAGVAHAPLLTPRGVVAGLEQLTMLPTVSGGPRTYLGFGPYDRKGFKGDFLTIRKIVDGVPIFDSYLSTVFVEPTSEDA